MKIVKSYLNSFTVFLIGAVFVFFSCKKNKETILSETGPITTELKNGFPMNIRAINGYLYASLKRGNGLGGNYSLDAFSVFNDPVEDLVQSYDHLKDPFIFSSSIGNINVGQVQFNGQSLNASNNFGTTFSYYSQAENAYMEIPTTVNWETNGNGSFKALDVVIHRGFPVIINTYTNIAQEYTLSINNGYALHIGNTISNYDSLLITINTFNSAIVKKNLVAGTDEVFFSRFELATLENTGSSGTLKICAYNYSNKIIENITYVFELSNKLQVPLRIFP